MGIEPTARCSRASGFEDQESHQASVASTPQYFSPRLPIGASISPTVLVQPLIEAGTHILRLPEIQKRGTNVQEGAGDLIAKKYRVKLAARAGGLR